MGIFDKKRIIVVCFFVFFCQMIFSQSQKFRGYPQKDADILSGFSDRGISVAQQTGFDITALHDAAIVMTENPFILCMSTNKISAKRAEGIMKDIAFMCGEEAQKQK